MEAVGITFWPVGPRLLMWRVTSAATAAAEKGNSRTCAVVSAMEALSLGRETSPSSGSGNGPSV